MASTAKSTAVTSLPKVRRKRAYSDYVHDQLQQTRTTTDHAQVLQNRAKSRITAAKAALREAGQPSLGANTTVKQNIDQYHTIERMLDEQAFYPPHDKRAESTSYARMHHQMTVVDDKHCLVCGVQHSTLGDVTKNPFGAIQMETHHHTVEWALANAIDEPKFNQHILPGLARTAKTRAAQPTYGTVNALYKEFDKDYASGYMTLARIKQWVDHAADNLWVLCDVHHRHKFVGIHSISYPIWGPQDVVDAAVVAKEIEAATGANAGKTSSPTSAAGSPSGPA